MIPYIVKGTIYVTPYMGDTYSTDDIRIVMAQDEDDAILKYEEHQHVYGKLPQKMESIKWTMSNKLSKI